jgi:hypothetical protein
MNEIAGIDLDRRIGTETEDILGSATEEDDNTRRARQKDTQAGPNYNYISSSSDILVDILPPCNIVRFYLRLRRSHHLPLLPTQHAKTVVHPT